ncbi:hypothetical protein FB451DRAFT_1302702 [Mycena latifolia]|nr:hypothetical protein FB451DRAFT_1302702 [Mycena latifolia]
MLTPSDFVDLSAKVTPFITFTPYPPPAADSDGPSNDIISRQLPLTYATGLAGTQMGGIPLPFPPATQGFLYLWIPPLLVGLLLRCPPSAIRFRRTASPEPSSFAAGTDLMHPTGLPWEIPLPAICVPRGLPDGVGAKWRARLKADGLLSDAGVGVFRTFFGPRRETQFDPSRHTILYARAQPFVVRFESVSTLWIVGPGAGKVEHTQILGHCFADSRRDKWKRNRVWPYSGGALMQFELLSPQSTRLVLRVLQITDPVTLRFKDYDGHVPAPIEGELLRVPVSASGLLAAEQQGTLVDRSRNLALWSYDPCHDPKGTRSPLRHLCR